MAGWKQLYQVPPVYFPKELTGKARHHASTPSAQGMGLEAWDSRAMTGPAQEGQYHGLFPSLTLANFWKMLYVIFWGCIPLQKCLSRSPEGCNFLSPVSAQFLAATPAPINVSRMLDIIAWPRQEVPFILDSSLWQFWRVRVIKRGQEALW